MFPGLIEDLFEDVFIIRKYGQHLENRCKKNASMILLFFNLSFGRMYSTFNGNR